MYEDGAIVMRSVTLDHYIIEAITLYDEDFPDGYTESFSSLEHAQIEAFGSLVQIYRDYEFITTVGSEALADEEEVSLVPQQLIGPKRVEVTIRAPVGGLEKRCVLLDMLCPAGRYPHYTATVREWVPSGGLNARKTVYASTSRDIVRIEEFKGGSLGSTTEHFTVAQQKMAWAAAEKAFKLLKKAEVIVATHWGPSGGPEPEEATPATRHDRFGDPQWAGGAYSGQHHTTHYQKAVPDPAFFRTSGDEEGAAIHKEQQAIWEEEGSPSAEDSLKEMLASKPGEEAVIEATLKTCPDCGGTDCPAAWCMADVEFAGMGMLLLH